MYKKAFINLINNSSIFTNLKRQAAENSLAHAYLFISQDTLAVNLIMQMLARFSLGLQYDSVDSFNADIHLVGSADRMAAADIGQMLDGILIAPSKGDKKFYLMPAFGMLRTDSQSKLLKTLEEPPFGTHILMSAYSEKTLLIPVVSRARIVVIPTFSTIDIYDTLSEYATGSTEVIKLASEISGGNLSIANNFLTGKIEVPAFNTCLNILKNIVGSKAVLDASAALSVFKDNISIIFDYVELILRDALMLHLGVGHLIRLKSIKKEISKLKELYSITAIEKIIPFINKSRRRKEFNANFNSLVDEFVFMIAEFRCKYI